MSPRRWLTVFLPILVVLIVLTLIPRRGESDSALVGQPAPEFRLLNLAGEPVMLSDFRDQVVVLDFWATWCPPCRASMPHLQEVDGRPGVTVLAVNVGEDPQHVAQFLRDNGYSMTVPVDPDGAAASRYGVEGLPTTFVIGPDGVIRNAFVGYGPGSPQRLDRAIADAAAKSPAS